MPFPLAAKAPLLETQASAFYRFNVGSIQATVVSDGLLVGVRKHDVHLARGQGVEKQIDRVHW